MVSYREPEEKDITLELFDGFVRRQTVTKCRRFENGKWVIKNDPFIDDWSKSDYEFLIKCLKNTVAEGGYVCAAFIDGKLKGFVSVEAKPIGSRLQYLDLSSLHVSLDARRNKIGKALFEKAADFARKKGAEKLYISSHSAVETQEFYKAMGCRDAEEINEEHTRKEPFDCQLEYVI